MVQAAAMKMGAVAEYLRNVILSILLSLTSQTS
jgi:hypothetical protein